MACLSGKGQGKRHYICWQRITYTQSKKEDFKLKVNDHFSTVEQRKVLFYSKFTDGFGNNVILNIFLNTNICYNSKKNNTALDPLIFLSLYFYKFLQRLLIFTESAHWAYFSL